MAALTSGSRRHAAAPAEGEVRLGTLPCGARGTIVGIAPLPPARNAAIDGDELERRLLEMGFIEGAQFQIVHEGLVGGDPIALRLDDTRIALRRCDAMALQVVLDPS